MTDIGFVLDHVFVAAEPAGASPGRLAAEGFVLTGPHVHPGQGTANLCLHVAGGYLELLWAHDENELASPAVRPSGLAQRLAWRTSGASPFGILLRAPENASLPFPVVPYRAPFADGRLVFRLAADPVDAGYPLVALLPPGLPARGGPTDHRTGNLRLEGVHFELPCDIAASAALTWLSRAGLCGIARGATPLLELRLGGATSPGMLDLQPEVPLRLVW